MVVAIDESTRKMGSMFTKMEIDEAQIEELRNETGFDKHQLERLYHHFFYLDKSGNGYISRADFLRIPELAINPLGEHLVDSLFVNKQNTSEGKEEEGSTDLGINFKQFVLVLARFRPDCKEVHPLSHREHKLEYAFKMLDIDNTGHISKENICHMLHLMVGRVGPDEKSEQLVAIAHQTMMEANKNRDGYFDFEEFKRELQEIDFQAKMSVKF